MASKRKRKKPLPDWVGESYSSKHKDDESDIECARKEEGREKHTSSSGPVKLVGANNAGVCEQKQFKKQSKISNDNKDEPLSAEEIIRRSLPLLKFEGSLIYSYNSSDCSFLCEEMLSSLSSEDVWHVGFDMEWPVSYTAGVSHKVAVIQVCTAADKCYIFHIATMATLPKALKRFLSHSQIIKYGINIDADFWKLGRDFDIEVRNVIRESVMDLGKMANIKLKSAERWTLDGLTRNVFRKRLDKEESVRCGKWDQHPLSDEQMQYAAADAYAGYLLANHLRDK